MPTPMRTTTTPKSYTLAPEGRATQLDKIYVGFIKSTDDSQRMGRLRVWIPELGGDPNDESQWFTMNYSSPFAGATNPYSTTSGTAWTDGQRSYGFWFVPPNLENEVVCCFINGDPGRGIWLGCLYQQYMNFMVPGLAGTPESNGLPVSEYNKLDPNLNTINPTRPLYTPLSDALKIQGLDKDDIRGLSTATARSNNPPNAVFGILTPGGSQMVFDDDPSGKYIRLRTQTGTQLLINDTEGLIYMATRDGKNWIEMSADGTITVYSAADINIRSEGTLNLRADIDVRIEAGRSIYMKARGEVGTRTTQGFADTSGQIQTATTTNTAQVPAIGINDSAVTIKVPTTSITGTFVQGMDISGIPWSNPVTNAAPVTSGFADLAAAGAVTPTAVYGSGQPTVVVGDSIAVGTGPALANLRQGVVTSATVGASSSATASAVAGNNTVKNAQWAVISTGSNDAVTTNDGKGLLTSNLFAIRNSLNAQNYTWILPKDPIRREVVYGFAKGKGDNIVDIGASTDGVHPKNYTELATNVNATIATQTKAPDNAANTNSTAAVTNPTIGAQLASFSTDGDYTLLNVSFPPGNQSTASNASVITGTLQAATNNTEQPTTNYNSTDGGMIMINAVKDMHLYANRDMYQTSDGRTARTAKGNLFDYSYGSYDVAVGGYLTMQSNGLFSLGTSNNLVLQGTRVDINGPAAAGALSAPSAKEPIDSFQQDNDVLAPGQFRFVVTNTILSALAYHEPYNGRGSGQSAQGRVESGLTVDQNGQSIPSGASTSGAARPLDLLGSPNPNSRAGYYAGTGYDSKGQPQYTYVSPPNGQQVSAGQLSLSPAGVNFLIGKESSRSTVYDEVGNPAIGYGHNLLPDEIAGNYVNILGTKRPLSAGPLSVDEINGLFRTDAAPREQDIRRWCKVPISQTQFDMLFSLVYNVGYPKNVFAKLNTGDYNVGTEWQSWHYATINGTRQSLPGLVSRRASEWQNFSGGQPINPSGSYS